MGHYLPEATVSRLNIYPNGTWTVYQYDGMNHLTNEVHYNGASQILAQYQYTVASDGTRLASVETRRESGGAYSTTQIAWTNDALHRLVREASSSTLTALNFTNSYVYDLAGNRLWKTNFTSAGTQVTGYTYNANDQLLIESSGSTSFTNRYDANGSVTNRSSASETNLYSYNLEGRLANATIQRTEGGNPVLQTNRYFYNQSGIRVCEEMTGSVNATNVFLNDPQNLTGFSQVLEELPRAGAAPTATYTLGSQIISQEKGGTNLYFMADGHGSTRLLTDTNGVVSDRYSYDAYGLALDFTFGTLTPLRTAMLYSGERFDSDLQQYYLRARYYNPVVGRFGAQDQVDGTPNDPLSLHKYAYTQNNPVNMRDPSGNEGELISTAFTMTIMDIIFKYEVIRLGGVAVSLTTESARASESLNQMENQPVTPDVHTATIIVHGVNGLWNGQPNGWSKDFQADLRAKDKTPSQQKGVNGIVTGAGLNQDFYEFDWGGFSFDGSGFYPIKSVHTMALIHLRAAEELILMKGYGFFNIISHSWGTTLSYDLMNSSNIEVDNWVTMGSPLKWTTEKPLENTGNWFNYYSSKDPVMHYEIYPPFPSFYEMANAVFAGIKGGQGLSGDSSQKINHPFDMGQSSFKEHTAYWSWLPCVDSLRKDLQ